MPATLSAGKNSGAHPSTVVAAYFISWPTIAPACMPTWSPSIPQPTQSAGSIP
jgi:hypothetical protein